MTEIQLESVRLREGLGAELDDPVGYAMWRGGIVVAAVEKHGRVWIDPALPAPDRLRAATLFAALLLFDPADKD